MIDISAMGTESAPVQGCRRRTESAAYGDAALFPQWRVGRLVMEVQDDLPDQILVDQTAADLGEVHADRNVAQMRRPLDQMRRVFDEPVDVGEFLFLSLSRGRNRATAG